MPPKKNPNKEGNQTKKCTYYDRGYCQYKEACKNKHPDKVCNDKNCSQDQEHCDKRHPIPCKFGFRCKFNKKEICLYSHVTLACDDDDRNSALMKKFDKKLDIFEKKVKELESKLKQKDSELETIKSKQKILEDKLKQIEEETGAIEERVLNQSISVLESSIRITEKETLKCESCNFVTESERGLKVHRKRKHEDLSENIFPQICDFCEIKCFDKTDLEEHLKKHTYNTLKFKCEDCDFLSTDELSLEVHSERKHTGNFACALCGFKSKSEDHLNTHLHTCETYTCDHCYPKIAMTTVSDLMSHLSSKHPKHVKKTDIIHTKMDRKDNNKVSRKNLSSAFFVKNTN